MKFWNKRLARIIFAIPFGVFGIFHLFNAQMMKGYVWVPGKVFWVYFSGVALILAAISLIMNKYTKWACYGLVVFLFITGFTIHLPHLIQGNQASMTGFLKDVMLLGAALHFAGHSEEELA